MKSRFRDFQGTHLNYSGIRSNRLNRNPLSVPLRIPEVPSNVMQYGTIIISHMQIQMISVKAKPEIHKTILYIMANPKKGGQTKGDREASRV